MTRSMTWMLVFDQDVRDAPGRMIRGCEGLLRWLQSDGEPKPAEEEDIAVTLDASIWGIEDNEGLERKWRDRVQELFVGLKLI